MSEEKKGIESLKYQKMLEQLEEIVDKISSNNTDLDDVVASIEKGYKLISEMKKRLNETKNKIEIIKESMKLDEDDSEEDDDESEDDDDEEDDDKAPF